jgi:signal transduction histidine kinase/ligand-binding sensor domain-containing protein
MRARTTVFAVIICGAIACPQIASPQIASPQIASPQIASRLVASQRTASQQSSPIADGKLYHTAWTLRDGAPAEIFALAQTRDGYLWLGTSTGLFRFDGVEFERFVPSRGESLRSLGITSLLALPDGALCIGYRYGGVSALKNGHLRTYGEADGLSGSTISALVRDSNGVVLAASRDGLFAQRGRRWSRLGTEVGLPAGVTRHAIVDQRGTVWITMPDVGIFSKGRNASRFVQRTVMGAGPPVIWSIVEVASGAILGARLQEATHAILEVSSKAQANVLTRRSLDLTGYLFADRQDYVWISTTDATERYAATRNARGELSLRLADRFTPASGMSGNLMVSMLTDREGNIWIGTEGGLDRFRHTKLARVDLPKQFASPAIVAGDRGDVWVGNIFGATLHVDDAQREIPNGARYVQATFRDQSKGLWFGSEEGEVWHSTSSSFTRDSLPAEVAASPIQALALDDQQQLWISVVRKGVYCRTAAGWLRYGNVAALPQAPAILITRDSSGALWFGYTGNRIARLARGVVSVYDASDGIAIGNVTAIHVARGHLWLGGENGVQLLEGSRFVNVTGNGDLPFQGVTGIVERATGELWLNGADGVTRIPASALDLLRRHQATRVDFERFDVRDGLDGVAPQLRPLPTAVASSDDALWLTTSRSAFRIDPAHIRRNLIPPPVHIRGIVAGGARYAGADTTLLPASTRAIQVRYTALSLGVPDRVRFRYQLSGSDADWQDAGGRRDAFYTNLRPGSYRFRVIASNDDGVWNDEGATQVIVIPPTFAETPAFLAICIAVAGLLALAIYKARLRSVSAVLRERYELRLAERTRIAQELHDTLLQGFTGITLQLQGVRRAIATRDAAAVVTLDRILTDADAALRDARHAVWDMRAPELGSTDVIETLTSLAHAGVSGTGIAVRVIVAGERRRLTAAAELCVARIGREAVTNAVQHASPTLIVLQFTFTPRGLTLEISDNGVGIDVIAAETAPLRGHFGISGAHERALSLGGTLTVARGREGGTVVTLVLPQSAL